jgi:rhodanese-related sulfurtransferase
MRVGRVFEMAMSGFRRKAWLPSLALIVLSTTCTSPTAGRPGGNQRSRISHWATGGTNLTEQEQKLSFIEREELFGLLESRSKILFVDVRDTDAFSQSHLPGAVNLPFAKRESLYSDFTPDEDVLIIPYCNWDFRAYAAGLEIQENGVKRIALLFPHGLRSWKEQGLPLAGSVSKKTDAAALAELMRIVELGTAAYGWEASDAYKDGYVSAAPADHKGLGNEPGPPKSDGSNGHTVRATIRFLPKRAEPDRIHVKIGDTLLLTLESQEEDHWIVISDFDVNLHLKKGETKTLQLDVSRSGYMPYGCITCCTKFRCRTNQAIVAGE